MFKKAAILGLGEAGSVFAATLLSQGVKTLMAYDILQATEEGRNRIGARAEELGVLLGPSAAAAVADADLIISTVTADQSTKAAEAAAPGIKAGAFYFDLNSCAPSAKRASAQAIEAVGGRFVEAVAMDTVPRFGYQVPLLLAGPQAAALATLLAEKDWNLTLVGEALGAAASIKLLRSVMVKGLEALFSEALLGAAKIGASDIVLESLARTFPGLDWSAEADYYLSRMVLHGRRRAAELRGSAEVLRDLCVEPHMAEAIAKRQDWAADLAIKNWGPDENCLTPADFAKLVEERTSTKA